MAAAVLAQLVAHHVRLLQVRLLLRIARAQLLSTLIALLHVVQHVLSMTIQVQLQCNVAQFNYAGRS